jgi:hypothetical protein
MKYGQKNGAGTSYQFNQGDWMGKDEGGPDSRRRAAAEILLQRADSIADLVDGGRYADARGELNGKRWLAHVDTDALPAEVLDRAQQWIDAAYDALSGSNPDARHAHHILLQLRRVITG